jgi:hypothetical protein
MKITNDQIKHSTATDGKPPIACRFYLNPYISIREGRNYIQYTLLGCMDISASYWKSLIVKETELVIDTRKIDGCFERINNVFLSFSELKEFLNGKLEKFGVSLK